MALGKVFLQVENIFPPANSAIEGRRTMKTLRHITRSIVVGLAMLGLGLFWVILGMRIVREENEILEEKEIDVEYDERYQTLVFMALCPKGGERCHYPDWRWGSKPVSALVDFKVKQGLNPSDARNLLWGCVPEGPGRLGTRYLTIKEKQCLGAPAVIRKLRRIPENEWGL
ncbi:MAG: hypothetical protein EXS55_02410 [Candidatus Magasanikbacteria bacterium]|nr:hypothetical protein [Candidatus Magasanikbacteria bacterium]